MKKIYGHILAGAVCAVLIGMAAAPHAQAQGNNAQAGNHGTNANVGNSGQHANGGNGGDAQSGERGNRGPEEARARRAAIRECIEQARAAGGVSDSARGDGEARHNVMMACMEEKGIARPNRRGNVADNITAVPSGAAGGR